MTERAREAISLSDAVVGYTRYVSLVSGLTAGKEVHSTGMTEEVQRCRKALLLARSGKTVAVISSGDSGIYGMAGVILQLASLDEGSGKGVRIEVIPGVPAFVSAASLLGAPLMHDFASISLSDLLTPWEKIEERLEAAASGDFVIILYNPKSAKRTGGLKKALETIKRHRKDSTPAGIVRNASREGEEIIVTDIKGIEAYYERIDMLTVVIIGNSATFTTPLGMITPRGYRDI